MVSRTVRRLAPDELGVSAGVSSAGGAVGEVGAGRERLVERPVLVLVGLTGAGKTTTVERLLATLPLAAVLPDRRALTDRVILPMMTEGGGTVADRVERFRLTAAFKDRYPGGMGDVLQWLTLPAGLRRGPVLFDGLRGAAEVSAAAALAQARFLVLDCAPELRLQRLCGRDDPFDRTDAASAPVATGGNTATLAAVLRKQGFDTLVTPAVFGRVAAGLAGAGVDPADAAGRAAIIVEESRHYDPEAARRALLSLAPGRTLAVDTGRTPPDGVVAAVAAAWSDIF